MVLNGYQYKRCSITIQDVVSVAKRFNKSPIFLDPSFAIPNHRVTRICTNTTRSGHCCRVIRYNTNSTRSGHSILAFPVEIFIERMFDEIVGYFLNRVVVEQRNFGLQHFWWCRKYFAKNIWIMLGKHCFSKTLENSVLTKHFIFNLRQCWYAFSTTLPHCSRKIHLKFYSQIPPNLVTQFYTNSTKFGHSFFAQIPHQIWPFLFNSREPGKSLLL